MKKVLSALHRQAFKDSVKAEKQLGEDITYCIRSCTNTDCRRNIRNAPIGVPVSAANFKECIENE